MPLRICFEWGGHYVERGEKFEWISGEDGNLYLLVFKNVEEITYSLLLDRIRKKAKIHASLKLKLSYFTTWSSVKPLNIRDDEDAYGFALALVEEGRRSVLHVEVVGQLDLVPFAEVHSSFGANDDLFNSCVGGNGEDVIVSEDEEPFVEPEEDIDHNGIENHVDVINENHVDDTVGGNLGNEDMINENPVDDTVDGNLGNEDRSGGSILYIDLPRDSQDSQFVDAWEDGLGLRVNQEFEDKMTVKVLVERAAHENCFGFVIRNSDTCRYVVKCSESKSGCKWHLRAAKMKGSNRFSVRTYTSTHTCSRASSSVSRRRGTPQLVSAILREDFPGQLDTPRPKNLMELVHGRIGVAVSYSTAYRGKKQALADIRGTPEDSYKNLYSYLYMLEQVNPGTLTRVELDEEYRFQYMFVALGACIEGFSAMRQVIIVDATHLSTCYGGVLVFATAQDPNHHHYPLAFAIVDGEKDQSWLWFFNTLKMVIPDTSGLVFISDRNYSLIKAIEKVYPNANHGYCTFHLSQNVRTKVSNSKKDRVAEKFREIAQIYTTGEFTQEYEEFCNQYPSVAEYLEFSVEVSKWARCHFPGARYNINTTNSAESMNAVFINARTYHLLPMMDAIVGKWSEWYNKNRVECGSLADSKKLVPFVENTLHAECALAARLTVSTLHTYARKYKVDGRDGKCYVVDMLGKSCSCRRFDLDMYPCVHALAAAMKEEYREYYELCSRYYWIEQWALAYTGTIYPVPHMSEWVIPADISQLYALPPKIKNRRRGRQRVQRYPSVGERRRKNRSVPSTNLGKYFGCDGPSEN